MFKNQFDACAQQQPPQEISPVPLMQQMIKNQLDIQRQQNEWFQQQQQLFWAQQQHQLLQQPPNKSSLKRPGPKSKQNNEKIIKTDDEVIFIKQEPGTTLDPLCVKEKEQEKIISGDVIQEKLNNETANKME